MPNRSLPGRVRAPTALVLALLALTPLAARAEPFRQAFPEVYAAVEPKYQAILDKIDLKHGEVTLGDGMAKVVLTDGYYLLDPAASKLVLEELWGNPPGPPPLGMIFPAAASPLHDSWGLTIDYDPMGYVSDSDAAAYDYDALLKDMQAGLVEENKERAKQGYQAVTLVGWAEPPHYDPQQRELYWAKDLRFEGVEGDTLNYNIRELGRRGVLVENFVAGMEQLPQVRAAVPDIRAMISFTDGNRYADFVPGVDTVAAVGIGGLIAGKLAAKAGLLVLLLAFLKKGVFLVLLPFAWLINKLKGGRGNA